MRQRNLILVILQGPRAYSAGTLTKSNLALHVAVLKGEIKGEILRYSNHTTAKALRDVDRRSGSSQQSNDLKSKTRRIKLIREFILTRRESQGVLGSRRLGGERGRFIACGRPRRVGITMIRRNLADGISETDKKSEFMRVVTCESRRLAQCTSMSCGLCD